MVASTSDAGSAGGNGAYTAGTGWDQVEWTWTFVPGEGRSGTMIEARLYSTPSTSTARTDYWIDHLCVTAPDHATIVFPEPVSPVEDSTWGRVKGLYR